jgi:hypothetical protein
VGRIGHFHLVTHRFKIRRLVPFGFLQVGPAEFGARPGRFLQAVLGALEKPHAQLIAQVLHAGLKCLLVGFNFGQIGRALQIGVGAFHCFLVAYALDGGVGLGDILGSLRGRGHIKGRQPRDFILHDIPLPIGQADQHFVGGNHVLLQLVHLALFKSSVRGSLILRGSVLLFGLGQGVPRFRRILRVQRVLERFDCVLPVF